MKSVWTKFKAVLNRQRSDAPPTYLKTVGWGPFPLPGERRRQQEAFERAARLMGMAEDIDKRF